MLQSRRPLLPFVALCAFAALVALPGANAQAGTNITLTLNFPVPTFNGTVINVTARLTDNNLVPIPGVNITFSTVNQPGAGSGNFITDANGTAKAFVTYNIAGNYTVNATFAGNVAYLPSTALASVLVYWQTQIPPVAIPNPVQAGLPTTITPTLTAITNAGVLPVTGATITLDYGDGTNAQFTTDQNGQAAVQHTYATAGSYVVTSAYAGTNGGANSTTSPPLYASSGTTTVVVTPVNTTGGTLNLVVAPPVQPPNYLVGVPITVTSQLLDVNGQPVPNAQITFTNNKGQSVPAVTNSTGFATATFTIPAGQQGSVTFTATTVGRTPTLTATQTVPVLSPTTTTLQVSPSSGSTGQTVTFTATVLPVTTGASGVGSTVTFNFGDGTSQVVTLNGTTATVTHVYSSPATFAVSAVAADNIGNFLLGSTSAAQSIVITSGTPSPTLTPAPTPPTPTPSGPPGPPASNITVVVSAQPGAIVPPECASLEYPITFTATLVVGSTFTGPLPTGFVTFIIIQQSTGQSLNLGTVPVNAPTQAYQTSAFAQLKAALTLPKGFYNIQATYVSSSTASSATGTLFNFYVDKKCEKEDLLLKLKDHWHDHIADALKDNKQDYLPKLEGKGDGKVIYAPSSPVVYTPGAAGVYAPVVAGVSGVYTPGVAGTVAANVTYAPQVYDKGILG